MKFFTREWLEGMTGEDADPGGDYWHHLRQIESQLPPDLSTFAREINLHDGLVRHAMLKEQASRFALHLRCGNEDDGYFDLDIDYGQLFLTEDVEKIARILNNKESRIVYDEVDAMDKTMFEHRIMFEPEGELHFKFRRFRYYIMPRSTRKFSAAHPKFKVE